MAYGRAIFPLILLSFHFIFCSSTSHLPCYPLSVPLHAPLSSAGRDTKGPVRQSNQELPWMAGAHISPSIPRYLSWQKLHLAAMIEEGRGEARGPRPLAAENKVAVKRSFHLFCVGKLFVLSNNGGRSFNARNFQITSEQNVCPALC